MVALTVKAQRQFKKQNSISDNMTFLKCVFWNVVEFSKMLCYVKCYFLKTFHKTQKKRKQFRKYNCILEKKTFWFCEMFSENKTFHKTTTQKNTFFYTKQHLNNHGISHTLIFCSIVWQTGTLSQLCCENLC